MTDPQCNRAALQTSPQFTTVLVVWKKLCCVDAHWVLAQVLDSPGEF